MNSSIYSFIPIQQEEFIKSPLFNDTNEYHFDEYPVTQRLIRYRIRYTQSIRCIDARLSLY